MTNQYQYFLFLASQVRDYGNKYSPKWMRCVYHGRMDFQQRVIDTSIEFETNYYQINKQGNVDVWDPVQNDIVYVVLIDVLNNTDILNQGNYSYNFKQLISRQAKLKYASIEFQGKIESYNFDRITKKVQIVCYDPLLTRQTMMPFTLKYMFPNLNLDLLDKNDVYNVWKALSTNNLYVQSQLDANFTSGLTSNIDKDVANRYSMNYDYENHSSFKNLSNLLKQQQTIRVPKYKDFILSLSTEIDFKNVKRLVDYNPSNDNEMQVIGFDINSQAHRSIPMSYRYFYHVKKKPSDQSEGGVEDDNTEDGTTVKSTLYLNMAGTDGDEVNEYADVNIDELLGLDDEEDYDPAIHNPKIIFELEKMTVLRIINDLTSKNSIVAKFNCFDTTDGLRTPQVGDCFEVNSINNEVLKRYNIINKHQYLRGEFVWYCTNIRKQQSASDGMVGQSMDVYLTLIPIKLRELFKKNKFTEMELFKATSWLRMEELKKIAFEKSNKVNNSTIKTPAGLSKLLSPETLTKEEFVSRISQGIDIKKYVNQIILSGIGIELLK
jgi:hypothetical protein